MELFLLYVWLKLDSIIDMFQAVVSLGVASLTAGLFFSAVGFWIDGKPTSKLLKRVMSLGGAAIVVGGIFVTGIPTKTQTAVLVGGHYALKMADTPEAHKIAGLLRKKANEFLDEELAEKKK